MISYLIRWVEVVLEVLGNLIVLAATVFAIISRETLTPGEAGLSISYALTVKKYIHGVMKDVTLKSVVIDRKISKKQKKV